MPETRPAGEDASGASGTAVPGLEGAELLGERELGPLGRVLLVERAGGPPARLALRPLAPEEGECEDGADLLREAARGLEGLDHPSLLRVLGIGTYAGREVLAVEWPEGGPLASLLAPRGLPPGRALEVARDCASALAALAERGVPHADFGAGAVFVRGAGPARVVPVAWPPRFRVEPRASKAGYYRGMPQYAAPELHDSGGRHPTERSNVFAFGVAFYEMLTGKEPFRGGTPTRRLLDIRESSPAPPSAHSSALPAEIERICLRCLEKDPDRRFPTFSSIEASLRIAREMAPLAPAHRGSEGGAPVAVGSGDPAAGGRAATGPPSTARLPAAAPARPSPRSSRKLGRARLGPRQVGIVAAVCVLVVSGLGLYVLSRREGGSGEAPEEVRAALAISAARSHLRRREYGEAIRLLNAHAFAREEDLEAYDDLLRRARLGHWSGVAERAEAAGRWAEAEEALDRVFGFEDAADRSRLLDRRNRAAFRAAVGRAEEAAARGEWDEACSALERAESLAAAAMATRRRTERVRSDLAFARLVARAGRAARTGDAAGETESLLKAARMRPDSTDVLRRLEGLGKSKAASEERLGEAMAAADSDDLDGAGALGREAGGLWPLWEAPRGFEVYLADRRSCEGQGMSLVTDRDPTESWTGAERSGAFCIDRYEFPNERGAEPRTFVSAVEAAALCRERGARLCRLSEWQLACGGPGGARYPFGDTYARGLCNADGEGLMPAGSLPGCGSAYGVFDMSGNVAEWTADRSSVAGGPDLFVAGGDWSSGSARSSCTSVAPFNPAISSARVGFRCCRPVVGSARGAPDE
jgi:hypothetical protein